MFEYQWGVFSYLPFVRNVDAIDKKLYHFADYDNIIFYTGIAIPAIKQIKNVDELISPHDQLKQWFKALVHSQQRKPDNSSKRVNH